MLFNSFIHFPSIGEATEKKIWESGVKSFDDFIKSPPGFISENKKKYILEQIEVSKKSIKKNSPKYFSKNLPTKEQWRIFKEFQHTAAYIDIETTGLGDPGDIITTIALYDGKNVKYYVFGDNLDDFSKDIFDYKLIVTFNGKTFDVPFIEKFFNIKLHHAHIDLRYVLKSLGFSGGLKSCERQLGIGREGSVADVDGFFAVILWRDYKKTGSVKSLETLLSYNIEDVINLEYLMIESYNQKALKLPINVEPIKHKSRPDNPFNTDDKTIKRLKRNSFYKVF